ncbi:MAG TPA: response regulator [Rhizomicrobium sp.]|nr:response regulator [Rhizomicrobium sp.]
MPKVLLIDDDAALTGMLAEFLQGEGFEIATAFNGREGAEAALDPALDAVILDVMMPDISGHEALQRIRAQSSVPVIMLTAKAPKTSGPAAETVLKFRNRQPYIRGCPAEFHGKSLLNLLSTLRL